MVKTTTRLSLPTLVILSALPRTSLAGSVTLAWDANTEADLAGYRLYYDVDAGAPYEGDFIAEGSSPIEYLLEDLDDPDNPQVTVHGVPTCMHVYFAVTAFDTSGGESGYSDEVDATVGYTPQGVTVLPGGEEGSLFIAWEGIDAGDTGSVATYRVSYGFTPGEPYEGTGAVEGDSPIDVTGDTTSLYLTGLTPGATVYVRVDSVCDDGTTKSSDEVSGDVATPECGNGELETGETCDPPESCPTTCDDENACTSDVLSGSAASCDALCHFDAIETCADGDGCCPAGCVHDTDDDCSESCGDGTIDDGETCDPPATCPTVCDDTDPCTTDLFTGSAENCNALCSSTALVDCVGGDGCCPSSCSSADDTDCSQSCGDGTIEAGETCDPPSSCPSSCETGDACSIGVLSGHPNNCNAQCSYSTIVACTSGDGCCPASCTADTDSDCGGGDGGDGEPTDQGGCDCATPGVGPSGLPPLFGGLALLAFFATLIGLRRTG